MITGGGMTGTGEFHAYRWSPDGTANGLMEDLGTLGGVNSRGAIINDFGEIVGSSISSITGYYRAFISNDDHVADLGIPSTSGNMGTWANAINNFGWVTGAFSDPYSHHVYLRYPDGALVRLGELGGSSSQGFGINDAGQVVGGATNQQGENRAFVAQQDSTTGEWSTIDLGTLNRNFGESMANAINKFGQIVGNSDTADGSRAGFLYTDGVMYNLNSLITSNSAGIGGIHVQSEQWATGNAINDYGQIAAIGTLGGNKEGQKHALILSPVAAATETPLAANTSYNIVAPLTNSNTPNATTTSLIGGIASADRTVQIRFSSCLPATTSYFGAASDVVNISGTGSDTFVVQVSYDEGEAINTFGSEGEVQLMSLDPSDNQWKLAVAGSSSYRFIRGAYDPATNFQLGDYGVDSVTNTVWAVINHDGAFAAGKVFPAPSEDPTASRDPGKAEGSELLLQ